jgi:hypothetical protein
MASWTGIMYPPPTMTPQQMVAGPHNLSLMTPTRVPQFKMTGYYVAGAVYETWTAYRYPNTTPPSGHALTNISYKQIQG